MPPQWVLLQVSFVVLLLGLICQLLSKAGSADVVGQHHLDCYKEL